MTHSHARDIADLEWFYAEAEGAIKRGVRSGQSTFEAEMEARSRRAQAAELAVYPPTPELGAGVLWHDAGLRCGPVYVGQGDARGFVPDLPDEEHPAMIAVARERRIRRALAGAGPDVELALRLRFREVLQPRRIPFGLAGSSGRRARPLAACLGVRLTPARGPGNLAHLTAAAAEAWTIARTCLDLSRWVDRLGGRVHHQGAVSPMERSLVKAIAKECEALELSALDAYTRARPRLPDRMRRSG